MMLVLLSAVRALVQPRLLGVSALALLLLAGACAEKGTKIPAGTDKPDEFLFGRGNTALQEKRWFTAREFFQTLIDTYPQSQHRADAKLGLADAYLGDGSPASQVLAINEYREFLSFFPTSPRADYAQYKLAMSHFSQMPKAGRDQTETREALKEFDVLFEKYPNSPLLTEARVKQREAKDRLGRSEYLVGITYYRLKWYPGVVARLQALLKADPQFTDRDAVYYYLADSLTELNRPAEAVPLLEKIPQEFEKSDYIEKAKKRLEEIKTLAANPPAPPKQAQPKQAQPKETPPKPAPENQTPQNQAPPKQTAPKQTPPKS
jgi:outer membrane protein assembly factor BamD